MPKPTPEQTITARFLSVMADHVGPAKRWKYKREFANAFGMLPQELYKVEKGASVQLRHLDRMQSLLNVNMNWMIGGKGEKYSQQKSDPLTDMVSRIAILEGAVLKLQSRK